MDKYEYQVCTEQIKSLIAERRFVEAMDVADTIDWRRVRSVSMLCTVSEIYKINKRYEDSRDILLLAYERHPSGRDIIYALCELAIKMNDIVQAIECYKEFVALVPNDPDSYVLLYKIYKAQDVSLEEQIDILEELKSRDYREKWAYELAYLYHLTGQETKCIAECDELILWFGEGKYVRKAMELKMQHTALTPDQQAKYDGRAVTASLPVYEQPNQQTLFGNNAAMTGPMMSQYGEYIQQTGQITGQIGAIAAQMPGQITGQIADQYGNPLLIDNTGQLYDQFGNPLGQQIDPNTAVQVNPTAYGDASQPIQVNPQMNHLGMTQDIIIQPSDDGRWSTMDLQEQLGNQVKEVLAMNVDGTQPIEFANNQEMFDAAQRDVTSPQLFEEKYTTDSLVHTGVIDLSGADLPPVENSSIQVDNPLPEKSEVYVSVEKRSLDQTQDILSQLQGVIPGTAPETKESAEVERIQGATAATGTVLGLSSIHSLPDDEPETGANGSIINKPQTKSEVTGAIPSFLPSKKDAEGSEEADTSEIEDTNETKVSEAEETEEQLAELKDIIPSDDDKTESNEVSEEKNDVVDSESTDDVQPESNIVVEKKPVSYPYDTVTDIGYVEELPELEQPDDVDDMLKTRDLPVHEIEEAQKAYETDMLPEVEEYEVNEVDEEDDDDIDSNIYNRMRKDIHARRELDDDEFRIFCRYDGIESLKAQLVEAFDLMSMEGSHGNIVVMGPENTDRKDIAINVVKVLKEKNAVFSGKVAKISGEALNKKNLQATLSKLENGALIVENAGGLTAESIVLITGILEEDNLSVLVVLEDDKENLKHLFKATKLMKKVFDARIDIVPFTNNDLVAYGRGYALEKEYTIDEMGTLALYNRIGEMQTYDHQVTIDEVKELIDTAIKHVDKKNIGHFMDMLVGKRYDNEDYIILREKDFYF